MTPERVDAVEAGADRGPWGPRVIGGHGRRLLRHLVATLVIGGLVATAAVGTTGALLLQQGEANLTRVPVPELDAPVARSNARHFLVVGSDSREGLTVEDRANLRLGSFEGQRADTVIYVSVSEDREHVSLVSLPRDLLVIDDGQPRKLADTYAGGPDNLVRVVRENFGLPVNHYAEVSLAGFVAVVRTLGSVEICLEEPLQDPKSGADFDAGCHDMDAKETLSFVRSRRGDRGDFERIDRQQQFIRAVLGELTRARVLADARRLFRLVEDVASNVTTDEDLAMTTVLGLSDELRTVVGDGLPMATMPAFPRRIDGLDFMVAYGPGARALLADLREGRPLPDRGTKEERDDTVVAVYSGGRDGADRIRGALAFAGFPAGVAGWGPESLDAGATTAIYALPGKEREAELVAATLRAPVRRLPADVTPPADATVVVATGDDAVS
jgi:LCP family protein required for cell wall assembly